MGRMGRKRQDGQDGQDGQDQGHAHDVTRQHVDSRDYGESLLVEMSIEGEGTLAASLLDHPRLDQRERFSTSA